MSDLGKNIKYYRWDIDTDSGMIHFYARVRDESKKISSWYVWRDEMWQARRPICSWRELESVSPLALAMEGVGCL